VGKSEREREREKETDDINIQSLIGRKSFQNLITTQHANEWLFGGRNGFMVAWELESQS
jgi:hypothetical protein